jgi:hypothetical protein
MGRQIPSSKSQIPINPNEENGQKQPDVRVVKNKGLKVNPVKANIGGRMFR